MAKLAKSYIKQWEADWAKLREAGSLPKGYGTSKPMSRKEYVQRQINAIEFASTKINKQIKELEKQLEASESKSEKKVLKSELENAKFYKEAIKTAVKQRSPENAQRYREEAERDIKVDFSRLKENKKQQKAIKNYKKNDDIYFRFLGISSHDKVTLSDGTTYTMEDLKKAVDKNNVNIKRTFFEDNITNVKYAESIYNTFMSTAKAKIKNNFGTFSRLPDRDQEGMRKLMGIEGINAALKY